MICVRCEKPIRWGELDLPLFGIDRDWGGNPVEPALAWSLAEDGERLWFVASHGAPARLHPQARPGRFLPGLWEHDVAELFLAHPPSGNYFEFNLAPNGAWWSCQFTAPRQRREEAEIAMPEVATFAELSAGGGWLAAMAIPLDLLRARLDFGAGTTANASFILGSPGQRFLTASPLGEGEPDFHRPAQFPVLRFVEARLFPPGGTS